MLTDEMYYNESLNANLFYLRNLRDFCINIILSFYESNDYNEKLTTIAKKSQDLGREIVTYTKGEVPLDSINYQIYYTNYTLKTEELTEKLFNINLATDITKNQINLKPTETIKITEEVIKKITKFNEEALSLANEFVNLATTIKEELANNIIFSYSYPALYTFMIMTINNYINELKRLLKKENQDPIIALDIEYNYNITSYEIITFIRGLIDTLETNYINRIDEILNEYPKIIEDYNKLALTPNNQIELTTKTITIINKIENIFKDMLEDLLSAKLYFIIDPLAIDNFYRNINYFRYLLNLEEKEEF